MQFRVKMLTSGLEVEEMQLEAADEAEARRVVASEGARLLSIVPLRRGLRPEFGAKRFNLPVFNQQLCSLLEAGQPIVDAIEILGRNDGRGKYRRVYDTLLNSLRGGKQLSDAMESMPSVFPALYIAMVRSSETTGTVRTSVRRYMQYQKQVDEIRGKLISAAVYPAVLLSVGFLVVAFLMLYVVPRFSSVFDDVSTSKQLSAGFVQIWGGFVRRHGVIAWCGAAAFVALFVTAVVHPSLRGSLFQRLLTIPWVGGKVHVLQLARLYRTLGMLLRSGVSVMHAMRMTTEALPMNMQPLMEKATEEVGQGHAISVVMTRCNLATEVASRLLTAGESSGNLDEMMERISDFYDQELAMWIDTAGRLIEPALMVGIGLIIGAVVLMLYMPIFDLTNAI